MAGTRLKFYTFSHGFSNPHPLTRLRACGQTVVLLAADLGFTEPETVQFLNDVMGLRQEAGSIAVLEEHTEGWIADLQMATGRDCAILAPDIKRPSNQMLVAA